MAAPARLRREYQWWERGVIYEIYPRSFCDSDGDGVGDLAGIRQKLPYLEWLGVDAIWIAPFYRSPMKDFGYDIADYTAVDPRFGDMAEFERLLADAHRRGLRVILDLVPNHSSDQHPWFREACRSRDDPRRDWYLWADPRPDGSPPNNWLSEFGGPAWEWHAPTGQFYYHAFDVSQPDLNWRNPAVHRAFFAIMRYWLDKGVDGFRVDVMWHLLKDPQLRDNPPNPAYDPKRDSQYHALKPVYSTDQPDVHHVVAEMRAVLDEYDERLMIGEIYLPIDELVKYYGVERSEAQMPFNFHLISTPWNAIEIHALVDEYEASVPPDRWPNWVLGNHDQPRVASRIGAAQARVAAVLLLTLRGTPTLYYGEELGMPDVQVPPHLAHDPRERRAPGKGFGRDPYRAPMPWDRSANAGFSRARPWLPLPMEWAGLNAAAQREDPESLLRLYHELLALRRREPALAVGEQETLDVKEPLFGYLRRDAREGGAGRSFAMLLNMSPTEQSCELTMHGRDIGGRIVLSTRRSRDGERAERRLRLAPDEAVVIAVE